MPAVLVVRVPVCANKVQKTGVVVYGLLPVVHIAGIGQGAHARLVCQKEVRCHLLASPSLPGVVTDEHSRISRECGDGCPVPGAATREAGKACAPPHVTMCLSIGVQCVTRLRSEARRVGRECASTCRSRWG